MSDPVIATLSAQYEAADTKTVALSTLPLQSNDQILILISQDQTGTAISLTGFSEVTGTTQADQSGTRSALLIKTSGASESDVTITGASAVTTFALCVLRGVDSTTPVNIASQSNVTGSSVDSPSVTTTAAGCYIVNGLGGWDLTNSWALPPINRRFITRAIDGNIRSHLCSFGQISAGATGITNWKLSRSDGGSAYTVAFNMDSGFEPAVLTSGATLVSRFGDVGNVHDGDTFTTLGSSISTINSISVETGSFSANFDREYVNLQPNYDGANPTMFSFNQSGGSGTWQGVTHPVSIDAAGKILEITIGSPDPLNMGPDGYLFILFDSSNNWEAFQVPKTELGTQDFGRTLRVSDETADIYDNSGTLDWTDINKVGYAWLRIGTSTSFRGPLASCLILSDTEVITGGSSGYPIKPSTIQQYLNYSGALDCADQQGLHTLSRRPVQLGDGTTTTTVDFSQEALESPGSTDNLFLSGAYSGIELYGSASCSFNFSGSIIRANGQPFGFNASTSTSATYTFNNSAIIGFDVTWISGIDCTAAAFIAGGEMDGKDNTYTNCSWSDSTSSNAALSIDLGADLIDCTFTKGSETYGVEIDTAGAYDFSGTTFTGYAANSDINVTASSGTVTITLVEGQDEPSYTSAGATVTFVQPVTTFTISVTGGTGFDIKLFETGTQTVLDSTTGVSLAYTYTGAANVDYTVMKAGFLPQRFTGVALANITTDVVMVADPVYVSSHSVVETTDWTYNTSTDRLTLLTVQNGVDVYSSMIENWISNSSYDNSAFPIQMNGSGGAFFLDGAEFLNASSVSNWRKVGVTYQDSGDTAIYIAVFDLLAEVPSGFRVEYQQTAGSSTTDVNADGPIDQLIQVFGDSTHGNINLRSHLVVKSSPNGFRQSRVDVLDLYGITELDGDAYPIAMAQPEISITTGDPLVTGLSITNHGATPVSWDAGNGSKDYSITITDINNNTGANIERWLNYNLSLDATFQGEDPFNWPYMVEQDGTKFRTERGVVEGSAGATLKGVRVVDGSGDPHPDFSEFTADDGTLGIPPAIATFRAENVADGANYMILHRQTFVVTEAQINTATNEITLTTDTNGDSPAFDVTTANRHSLVRITLAGGATIPTTTGPQIINNGTYRVASQSGSVITIEMTEGGGAINFTDDGTNGTAGYVFAATFETLIAQGATTGGSGVSESFVLPNNATYRFKTIHQDTTGGPRKSTNFIDVVGSWSNTVGASYSPTVDATDTAQSNLWTESNQIADIDTFNLLSVVKDNAGNRITSFNPVDDGADIGGVSFALEGKGFIQINVSSLTKNAVSLNGALAAQDLAMWAVYEISKLDNMYLASDETLVFVDLANLVIDNVEFDETSGNYLQIYGATIREKDGEPIISSDITGSIAVNVAVLGNASFSETGTSGLTGPESTRLFETALESTLSTVDGKVDTLTSDIATVDGKTDTIITDVEAVKTDTVSILADTNEIQGDLADGGRIDMILDGIQTSVDSIDAANISDVLLGRSIAGGADGGRTVRDALRANRNRVVTDRVAETLTVYQEDGITVAWSASIIIDDDGCITEVNPA